MLFSTKGIVAINCSCLSTAIQQWDKPGLLRLLHINSNHRGARHCTGILDFHFHHHHHHQFTLNFNIIVSRSQLNKGTNIKQFKKIFKKNHFELTLSHANIAFCERTTQIAVAVGCCMCRRASNVTVRHEATAQAMFPRFCVYLSVSVLVARCHEWIQFRTTTVKPKSKIWKKN